MSGFATVNIVSATVNIVFATAMASMIDLWSTILAVVVDVLVRLALLRIGPAFPANATEWPPPSTLVAKWRIQANGDPPRQSPKRRCGPQLSLCSLSLMPTSAAASERRCRSQLEEYIFLSFGDHPFSLVTTIVISIYC